MESKKMVVLVMSVFLLGMVCTAAGQTVFVDADAAPGGDGQTWATAYKYLQDALTVAEYADEIWVAQGIYTPDANSLIPDGSGDRTATFQLISGVALYGGFAGSESTLDQRDWQTNETILTGDLNGDDVEVADPQHLHFEPTRAENSYHVVTGSGTDETAVLDGFTITAGNANGSDPYHRGGGMYNGSGSPTLTNCTFSGNSARHGGGGMYNTGSSPAVTNCTFIGNSADGGGGMYNTGGSPAVTNCTFSGNSAGVWGGGMWNGSSSPTVTNCTFSGNRAGRWGGAMVNTICSTRLTNCTFSGNSAGEWGGVMFNQGFTPPTMTNCTFSGNSAGVRGGVMYNYPSCVAKVTNCILWGNTAPSGAQIAYYDVPPRVFYSDVQGGWPGEGNINADPCFVDPGNEDYHLLPDSPCIDAGDNTALPPDTSDLDGDGNTTEPIPFDLDGNPRFVDCPDIPDTGNGTPPIVDMGAYEAIVLAVQVVIDIKPGSYPNAINLGSHGLIPVAIFSSEDFDATTVDPDTVELAGSSIEVKVKGKSNKYMAHGEDVDGDGLLDLVVQVATANLDPDSLQDGWAVLTAKTYDGQDIKGEDEITIVPPEQ